MARTARPFELGSEPFELGSEPFELDSEPFELGSEAFELGSEAIELGSEHVELGSEPVELGSELVGLGSEPVELGSEPMELVPSLWSSTPSLSSSITNVLAGRCVQSRTHRTSKYVWFLSHTPSHTHMRRHVALRDIFVDVSSTFSRPKNITGLLILPYLRLYLPVLHFFFGFSSVSVG